ncbi:MAG: hypothetical protein DI598_02215 [Pseudopedobacter saltans]|uniref:Secretion system C-terminal sorting domain-containing protein n=1 Tax=Pseudopedobacter saltans TaxID=151895 RepID=A0A2W5F737_9SPHI|nr:MAG: hypothetical protein DI598_02215 [Pseudopedobacter saltans]
MKRFLHTTCHIFGILMVFICFSNDAHAASVKINDPVVNVTDIKYRWRQDVNDLGIGAPEEWYSTNIQSANSGATPATLSPISKGVIYRIRLGGNFKVTVTATINGNTETCYISSWAPESSITYTAYYAPIDARNTTLYPETSPVWKKIPTSATEATSGLAPFYMQESNYLYNGQYWPADESQNMLVLPKTKTSSTFSPAPVRPDNPYFYMGGAYYIDNPGTVGQIGYTYGSQVATDRNNYPDGNGGFTSSSAQKYLNLGAEIESSIVFTNLVAPLTTYTILLVANVPFSGNGYTDSYGSGQSRSLSGTAKITMRGAFVTPSSVLPIELTSFNVANQGGIPKLEWNTATEINNKGFHIQRSSDGKNFNNIDFVASKGKNGNSSTPLSYSYSDLTAGKTGIWYYRLLQEDLDGKTDKTGVVHIDLNASTTNITVGPNPVASNLIIKNAAVGSSYVVYSVAGQTMLTGTVNSNTSFSVNVNALPSGMYVIKITGKAGTQTKKFMRQ